MKRLFFFTTFLLLFAAESYAQEDTAIIAPVSSVIYYTDLSDLLALKMYSLLRFNSMEVSHENDRLDLSPNSPLSIGGGINYKGIGVSLGFGLPHSSSSIYKYGNTSRFDMRGSFSGKKFGGNGYFQLYKGYYVENPQDFVEWDKDYFPQIPDLHTISVGVSGYYVLNYNKFSNKAATSRTQIQNRSAGSLLPGIFMNYDEAESQNGFFPSEFPDSIGADLNLQAFRYFATGISIGYTYTWVISNSFFLNGLINPGGGYKDIRVTTSEGDTDIKQNVHVQLALRGELGYENKYFYAGLTASTLIRSIETKDYNINLATEQIRLFIGYRFNVGKKIPK